MFPKLVLYVIETYRIELLNVPKDTETRVWSENVFFLVMDSLVRAVDSDAREGLMTLEMKLTPQGGDEFRRILHA